MWYDPLKFTLCFSDWFLLCKRLCVSIVSTGLAEGEGEGQGQGQGQERGPLAHSTSCGSLAIINFDCCSRFRLVSGSLSGALAIQNLDFKFGLRPV